MTEHDDGAITHTDPGGSTDFPHDEVFRRLDNEQDREEAMHMAGQAMHQLIMWSIKDHTDRHNVHLIVIRMMAMVWTINPDSFSGISLTELAKYYGVSVDAIHRASGEFRRAFRVRNAGFGHAWNFKPQKR